jgi:hypothetical protein
MAYNNKRSSGEDTDKNGYTGYKPKDEANKTNLDDYDSIDKNSKAS